MGSSQHIHWLIAGVEAWNKRRAEEKFTPDLQNEDITGLFGGVHSPSTLNPPDPVLRGINLSDAKLNNAVFENFDLSDSNFAGAYLDNARLSGSQFTNTSFYGTHLNCAKLIRCNLAGTKFQMAWLQSAHLTESNLLGAEFLFCHLDGADFHRANLQGADFPLSRPWTAQLFGLRRKSKVATKSLSQSYVKSVEALLQDVRELRQYHEDDVVLYFRGEGCHSCDWELRPSIMRKPKCKAKALRPVEGEMLNDLMTNQPDAFNEQNSALAQWVLAQHHKLPTRFLDITRNPLVALFNACHERLDGDGRLHIFAVPRSLIKPFDSDAISVIANFAKLPRWEKNLLLGKIQADAKNDEFHRLASIRISELTSRVKVRLYDYIRREKPYFQKRIDIRDLFSVYVVEPQRMFDRIRAQSGAFLISAFHERFEDCEVLDWNQDIPIYTHYVRRVPCNSKRSILRDLNLLNVTRETLLPSVDESSDAVTQRFLSRSNAIDDKLTPPH